MRMKIFTDTVINNIPGMYYWTDHLSNFLLTNKTANTLFGIQHSDKLLGEPYETINCSAAEYAETFRKQDNLVFESKAPLKMLAYYGYSNGVCRLLCGQKQVLKHQNKLGIVGHFMEIPTNKDNKKIIELFFKDKQRYSNQDASFSYYLHEPKREKLFTKRQLEVLFFYIRGHSAKQIAKKLFIDSRTVEDHISKMKEKINCHTRQQLIESCINQGYLNMLPISCFQQNISLALD